MSRLEYGPLCPECGHCLDSATAPDDAAAKPVPGSYSVCLYCASPLQYVGLDDSDLVLRAVTHKQLLELPPDLQVELMRYIAAVKRLHRSDPSIAAVKTQLKKPPSK